MELQAEVKQDGETTLVIFKGPINGHCRAALEDVLQQLKTKACTFNLKDIEYIDSLGIRNWINFVRVVDNKHQLTFEECCPDVVMQINMIPEFSREATISSLQADYTCPRCDLEQVVEFKEVKDFEAMVDEAYGKPCPECGAELEMDENVESFFNFTLGRSSA